MSYDTPEAEAIAFGVPTGDRERDLVHRARSMTRTYCGERHGQPGEAFALFVINSRWRDPNRLGRWWDVCTVCDDMHAQAVAVAFDEEADRARA